MTVWSECDFKKRLDDGLLNLPTDRVNNLPYVFVGDCGFKLTNNFMTPFRQRSITNNARKIFNRRLARARRIVEQVYGIMANRFGILHKAIKVNPDNAKKITAAICILHNMLIEKNRISYLRESDDEIDSENDRIDLESESEEDQETPTDLRYRFTTYFLRNSF